MCYSLELPKSNKLLVFITSIQLIISFAFVVDKLSMNSAILEVIRFDEPGRPLRWSTLWRVVLNDSTLEQALQLSAKCAYA